MIMMAKLGLGVLSTLAVAGAYTFREGVVRVDVDEHRDNGSHVHLWMPAAAISTAMHFVPQNQLDRATREAREWLPVARAVAHELGKLPDSTFVEVQDGAQHVMISTQDGALEIDVTDPEENVHVRVPLATIEDITQEISQAHSGA
jgi:hypothetical protein